MNTRVNNYEHSQQTQAVNEVDLSSIYPSPEDVPMSKIFFKALLINVPLFLVTLCLILLLSSAS